MDKKKNRKKRVKSAIKSNITFKNKNANSIMNKRLVREKEVEAMSRKGLKRMGSFLLSITVWSKIAK